MQSNSSIAGKAARIVALFIACAAMPAALTGCGSRRIDYAALAAGDEVLHADYRLGAGDRVHIQVFGEDDLSGDADVDGDGTVSVKLIGRVAVGDKTSRQAEEEIAARLSKGYVHDPRVNVDVLIYRPFYILGEVAKPGAYPFTKGLTVAKAAALAGGFSYRAATDDLTIMRDITGRRTEIAADQETPVMPGDVIHILERWF